MHRTALAARVTAQIVDLLQHGVRPWTAPWSASDALALPLRANGLAYKGVNILMLWAAAQKHGYASRHWFTFKHALAHGAAVRRGERATHITYYSGPTPAPDTHTDSADKPRPRRAILRTYAVFNADQIDGLPSALTSPPPRQADTDALAPRFAHVPASIRHGGARACYNPATDTIHLPPQAAFASTPQYYATLLHELAHWTGHPTRLNRPLRAHAHDPRAYAREELVAELTAAFLGAELDLPVDHIEDHSAYLAHWLQLLTDEPAAFLTAAAQAQTAADYLRHFLRPPREAA